MPVPIQLLCDFLQTMESCSDNSQDPNDSQTSSTHILHSQTSSTHIPDSQTSLTQVPDSQTSSTQIPDSQTSSTQIPDSQTSSTLEADDSQLGDRDRKISMQAIAFAASIVTCSLTQLCKYNSI